jgi:hypothetical protein
VETKGFAVVVLRKLLLFATQYEKDTKIMANSN